MGLLFKTMVLMVVVAGAAVVDCCWAGCGDCDDLRPIVVVPFESEFILLCEFGLELAGILWPVKNLYLSNFISYLITRNSHSHNHDRS